MAWKETVIIYSSYNKCRAMEPKPRSPTPTHRDGTHGLEGTANKQKQLDFKAASQKKQAMVLPRVALGPVWQ